MRVISVKRLREFWNDPQHPGTESSLRAWNGLVKDARWRTFAEVRATFGSVDLVGNCLVFDVAGNRLRLIGRANYRIGRLYILKVMTHAEYDEGDWVAECGCRNPPPAPRPRGSRRK